MNKQIQKLYDQADKFAKENRTQNIAAPGNNYFELFHEKFAELIVRECLDIAQDRAAFDGFPPNDVNHIIDEIREHFGVSEREE